MRRALRLVVACDLLFLVLLSLSGMTGGWISNIIYISAFALPAVLGLLASRRLEDRNAGNAKASGNMIRMEKGAVFFFLPIIFPTLIAILALSFVTSLILGAFGFADGTVIEGNFPTAVLNYAILPAVLEELLFRYLPIRLMGHHSPRGTVLLSSVFFALVHMDLFRIPYAFLAGLIFVIIDMLCESMLPSLVIHFINNFMSVVFGFYPNSMALTAAYISVLIIMSALSVLAVLKQKNVYKERLHPLLGSGSLKDCCDLASLALIIPTVFVALLNLFAK